MSKVKELFGLSSLRNDVDWRQLVREQHCLYTGRRCLKIRKSIPGISIGVCTVEYSRYGNVVICPHRMLERRQIFIDCVHLLALHEPGNELHFLSEVSVPGGSVDYFLASVHQGRVVDFVGIELQALDSTGSLWGERALFLQSKGVAASENDLAAKNFGINWKMSAKTILVQMHHKIQTFEHLAKHLVLVVQDCFSDYMAGEFDFSHIVPARLGDSFHLHSYSLKADTSGHLRWLLQNRTSTDANGIARCLGLQADAKIELKKITGYLETRISEKTQLRFV